MTRRTLLLLGLILAGCMVGLFWEHRREQQSSRTERPPVPTEVALMLQGRLVPPPAVAGAALVTVHFPELPCDLSLPLGAGDFQRTVQLKTLPERLPRYAQVEASLPGCRPIVLEHLALTRDPLGLRIPVLEFQRETPEAPLLRHRSVLPHNHDHAHH